MRACPAFPRGNAGIYRAQHSDQSPRSRINTPVAYLKEMEADDSHE